MMKTNGKTRLKRWVVAAALGLGVTALPATGVDAGFEGDVNADVYVTGPDAATVRDGLDLELYELPSGTLLDTANCSGTPSVSDPHSFASYEDYQCDVPPQSGPGYAMGITGVPDGWTVSAFCADGGEPPAERIPGADAEFMYYGYTPASCEIIVRQPIIVLDKVVVGGEDAASASEFTLEIYSDGSQVTTAVDPSDSFCDDWDQVDSGLCAAVGVPAGEYTLGELPLAGYEATAVECTPIKSLEQEREALDDPDATIDVTETDVYCRITNTYFEGRLVVTASVNNDDGGTAGVTDVSVEVYEDGVDTPVVPATACASDGSCLDTMLPVGDYVLGYTGPDGYTREVTQSVTAGTTTTTTTILELVEEQITDDPDAEFTIEPNGLVEIEVAIDDPQPEPTTTTTEPATTTTAFDAGAGTLPPTGWSDANGRLALVALALIAAGGALIGVRRRAA